ncbi:MAG: hypothetical protein KDI79_15295 [Anaerolineae bacterium]|nr:hypothetical protein [Anaerolineae bacterium]
MLSNRITTAVSLVALFAVGLAMLLAAPAVIGAVGVVATPTAVVMAVVISLTLAGLGGALVWGFLQAGEKKRMEKRLVAADVRQRNANALKTEAEAALLNRQANFEAIVAPAGQQVFGIHFGGLESTTKVLHTSALTHINGLPQNPTPMQIALWERYHQLHAPGRPELLVPEAPKQIGAPTLPPILPKLIDAQRLIIAGGSDAGKTTLIKHIVAGRIDHSRIIPIDPHAPSKILGFDVIGAGRDYGAIGDALESLVLLMTARYEDVKAGVLGYGQHERVSVFIDEWTGIVRQVDGAGDLLAILLTESRKVNIHLTLCCHSTTIDALGLPDAQIRKSATVVEITGGNGAPRRAFIHPASKTNPDGSKATPQEYALPGPFAGYVQAPAEVVRALPDSKVIKAQLLFAEGASDYAVAKEYFGVKSPNQRHVNEIRELREQVTDARQGADND